jgi:ribosomal protein S18 acetylase RimI-like enzyme
MIRPARKTDAREAAVLIRVAIEDIAKVLTGMQDEAAVLAFLEQFFQAEVNRLSYHNAIVKELDGHLAGIIVLYHGRDAEYLDRPIIEHLQRLYPDTTITLDAETAPDEFYIDTLSVSPQFSGRGIGTALIQAAEQRARRLAYPKITLNVHIHNAGAYRLYARLGYYATNDVEIDGALYHHMIKQLD